MLLEMICDRAEPCQVLAWDSEFWGFAIAKVTGGRLDAALAGEIDRWCSEQSIRCLYFLASSDDPVTVSVAEAEGFRFVDVRMTFVLNDPGRARSLEPDEVLARSNWQVRLAQAEDVELLAGLARSLYTDSRFYHDGNFPRERCDLLYQTWIRKSCAGWADAVLVAERSGERAGYLTCHIEKGRQAGRVGLVGVAATARGQGVGQGLVRSALTWFRSRDVHFVRVVTQGRNVAAQRLYQTCGFVTESLGLWYHKWYPQRRSGDRSRLHPPV